MTWLRLEAAYFSNPAMIRAGWDGKVVFLALLTMTKLHHARDGSLDHEDCEPEVLRAHLGTNEQRHSDEQLRHGIAACVRVGLIEDDGSRYTVRAWGKHQIDHTAPERSKRYRDKKKAERDVTPRHGNHGDRTGQDRTGQRTPNPLSKGGGLPSASSPEPDPEAPRPAAAVAKFDTLDIATTRQANIDWAAKEASMSRDVGTWRAPAQSIRADARDRRPYPDSRVEKDFATIRSKDERGLGAIVRQMLRESRNGTKA